MDINSYGYLDRVRVNEGIDRCISTFSQIYRNNMWRAIALINDQRLTFPTLFILREQIKSPDINPQFSKRPTLALRITSQILEQQEPKSQSDYLLAKDDPSYTALKWMFKTGCKEESIENDFDRVIDAVTSVLIGLYKDNEILPDVVDMIFSRNKAGKFIHDLVWALFNSRNPTALKLIAQHILSQDKGEAEFACDLLNIGDVIVNNDDHSNSKLKYKSYIQWLEDNDPFLYFTGESFQFSSKPNICAVDLERKYMNIGTQSYNMEPLAVSNIKEKEYLEAFKPLNMAEKTILSNYSQKIRNKNVSDWEAWMHLPVEEQIKTANAQLGVAKWL